MALILPRVFMSAHCVVGVTSIPKSDLPFARLPPSVIEQGNQFNEKRRQQYLAGRVLLAELLFELLGIAELPEIQINQNGRPAFCEDYLPDFNISHSGNQIMVALGVGCQIGLDLEQNRERAKLLDLAKYNFSEVEYQWLLSQSDIQQQNSFWQLWTLREATLKLVGGSVWQMAQIKIDPYQKTISADFLPEKYSFSFQKNAIAWALISSEKLTKENIELKRFDWDSGLFDSVVIQQGLEIFC